jgi:hypothetical protein
MTPQWAEVLSKGDWEQVSSLLKLSPGQADFLWHALHDSRDVIIAERMSVSLHGAHAHRVAVFRKLKVDSMPAAIARVFAAYVIARKQNGGIDASSATQ